MRRSGFTLLELVVVVIILAVLSGVGASRFFDYRTRARQSAEAATVGAVRSAIRSYMTSAAVQGTPGAPASLDAVAASGAATPGTPMFTAVMQVGVTDGWTKGTSANVYVGPTGTSYTYDQATGLFDTPTVIAAAQAAAGGSSGGGWSNPQYTVASTWTATSTPLAAGQIVGAGYTLNNGVLELTDTGGFSEASRRTAIVGQAISAGSFTLALDTRLTNYWNQLNYWQVYAVAAGTNMNLSGSALQWGTAPAGAKLLAQNYAPESMSNGNWYSYNTAFTVSAADAASYSQIVVMMAGTRNTGQTLSWRNISIFPTP